MHIITNFVVENERITYNQLKMSKLKIKITKREVEVLDLLSRGLSSKDIAEKLFISANTVEYHRKQLLRKTESHNVAELIGNAFRKRLLQP